MEKETSSEYNKQHRLFEKPMLSDNIGFHNKPMLIFTDNIDFSKSQCYHSKQPRFFMKTDVVNQKQHRFFWKTNVASKNIIGFLKN